ncbi:hypothetical protein AVEN_220221-1 [Araneus ventricosus]|uniref:Uncharacterized protein n=1 Tax=Araneus ventricosus TaxID=182803 RepID=A0A4Y2UGA9_ARAVE|nr:hypothetical protein AVEN_220221-1 [Araneus ventricosus]
MYATLVHVKPNGVIRRHVGAGRNSPHPFRVRCLEFSVKREAPAGAYKWARLEKDTEREPEAIMIPILCGHTHHCVPPSFPRDGPEPE